MLTIPGQGSMPQPGPYLWREYFSYLNGCLPDAMVRTLLRKTATDLKKYFLVPPQAAPYPAGCHFCRPGGLHSGKEFLPYLGLYKVRQKCQHLYEHDLKAGKGGSGGHGSKEFGDAHSMDSRHLIGRNNSVQAYRWGQWRQWDRFEPWW